MKYVALTFLFFLQTALGQTNTTKTQIKQKPPAKVKKFWNISLNSEYSTNLYRASAVEKESATSLTIAPSIGITEKLNLSILESINRMTTGQQETTLSDLRASLAYKNIKLAKPLTMTPGAFGIAPTSKVSQKDKKLLVGFGLEDSLTLDFIKFSKVPATISYRIRGTQNVHEYVRDADGAQNIQYTIGNRISPSVSFLKSAFLSGMLEHVTRITYKGNKSESFVFAESIGYDFSIGLSLYAFHTNEAALFKYNNSDSNFNIYDDKTSTIGIGANYVF